MNEEEADELIDRMPFITAINVNDRAVRYADYESCLLSDDPVEWIRVIKSTYLRMDGRDGVFASFDARENAYRERAVKLLYGALSAALGSDASELEGYINKRLSDF